MTVNPRWTVQQRVTPRNRSWLSNKDWPNGPSFAQSPIGIDWNAGCLDTQKSDSTWQCDEFPNASMSKGGNPNGGQTHAPLDAQPAIAWSPASENLGEGGKIGSFYTACGLAKDDGKDFLVVPTAGLLRLPILLADYSTSQIGVNLNLDPNWTPTVWHC